MLTRGIPPDFRGGVNSSILPAIHHRLSPELIKSRKMRTDGVHCRASAGTGLEVFKVVPVAGASCASPINYRLSSPTSIIGSDDFSVQYGGGFLPDIILLTIYYYLWGTQLSFPAKLLAFPLKHSDNFSPS